MSRLEELLRRIGEKLKEIPYIDNLLAIKGIGMVTVSGFIAEVWDIRHFDNLKQLQKLAGYAIVANDSGKHSVQVSKTYKNESLASRNIFRRAGPWLGAKRPCLLLSVRI